MMLALVLTALVNQGANFGRVPTAAHNSEGYLLRI
jgi:hypothetical protein